MRALLAVGLIVAAAVAESDTSSDSNSDSVVVEGRKLNSDIRAADSRDARYFPGGGYPGGGYPGGVYPGGGYPGYQRPSNCKNWCRRQSGYGGGYPGYGRPRIQYYCCDHSGPVVVPGPYPVPYPGPYPQPYPQPYPGPYQRPYPGVYSGSGSPPAPPPSGVYNGNNGYTTNNGYATNNGYTPNSKYTTNNGYTTNKYTTNNGYTTNSGYTPNNRYTGLGYSGNRVCPPPRPYCVTSRNFASPPTECAGDYECSGVDRCCYDTCLEHRVCKTADIAAPVGPVPFSARQDLVRHADSDILADDDASDVSGDVTSGEEKEIGVRAIAASEAERGSGKIKFLDVE